MKPVYNSFLTICIILFLSLSGCELLSDNNDDCEATKMDEPQEPIIYLKPLLQLNQELGDSYLLLGERLNISGSIRKIYCNGDESGVFSFNPTFYLSDDMTVDDFFLPQPYQYKFNNTRDKLVVISRVKVYFENGNVYESSEVSREFFYKDIKLDANLMKYYIELDLYSGVSWYDVTPQGKF